MRGLSRHAVARYRRRPRMRFTWRADGPAPVCVRKSAPHSGAATQTGLHPGRFRRQRPVALQFGIRPVPKASLHAGRRLFGNQESRKEMAPVSSLFLMFLISLFNPYGAVSISIAIFLSPNSKPKTQNPKLLTFLVGYSIALSRLKPACPKSLSSRSQEIIWKSGREWPLSPLFS